MTSIKQLESPLTEAIAALFDRRELSNQDGWSAYRKAAMQEFGRLGFPSVKNEEWRFTNILPLVKTEYVLDEMAAISEADMARVQSLVQEHCAGIYSAEEVYRLVLVNGAIVPSLSVLPAQEGVSIQSLRAAQEHPQCQAHFGTVLQIKDNAFAALNSAMFEDGLFVHIADRVALEKPLHVVKVLLGTEATMHHSRDLFVLGKHAELKVIETYITDIAAPVLVNAAAEVVLAENAMFDHYDVQKADNNLRIIQRTEATQNKHSNYSNYIFTFPGAAFVRNNLALHLNEADLESHLYGLYISAATQLVDNHTEVHHKMPRGESNQLYKGIVMDNSRAVFNGKIFVYQDAQKTNAFQQSNNILFSDNATVHAKPQLEIFADDVKCSHGSTIGQLNKDAMFYLRSRGIGEQQAKQLMVEAFAYDVVEKVKLPFLKEYLSQMMAADMGNQK